MSRNKPLKVGVNANSELRLLKFHVLNLTEFLSIIIFGEKGTAKYVSFTKLNFQAFKKRFYLQLFQI